MGRLERELEQQQPSVSRVDWPSLVPDHRKTEIMRGFREATSTTSLKMFVCASCSVRRCCDDSVKVDIVDIDLNLLKRPDKRLVDGAIVDSCWFDSQCVAPLLETPWEELHDVLVMHEGVVTADGHVSALLLCGQCWGSLKKERMPDLSLANHLFLGIVPAELQDLTVVEEAMIARCRAKSWIIQLQE